MWAGVLLYTRLMLYRRLKVAYCIVVVWLNTRPHRAAQYTRTFKVNLNLVFSKNRVAIEKQAHKIYIDCIILHMSTYFYVL
jgi:hypothetical protein